MRTTMDIPDALFRQIKAKAALKGQTMRVFFIEALQEKLRAEYEAKTHQRRPAWTKYLGSAPKGAREQIDAIVELEFSGVNPEDWE